ncbi:glycine--tRNA ligase subunit beta, partial [Myxococcota bacterium]|nr:glycine--tRNA ligase subunit beta [Myxococcota bacterium]
REFFRTRLRGLLVDDGVSVDVAEAVLAAGYDDVVDTAARAQALAALRKSPEFEPIAATFKRVGNILKDQDAKASDLETSALDGDAEKKLFTAAAAVSEKVARAMATRDFGAAIATIAELRPVVDEFFGAVMVMDKDPAVKKRRLALVAKVHEIFAPLADLTKLS